MKVRFIAKWYDLWIGVYWDRDRRLLYVLPVPCLGVVFDFGCGDCPKATMDRECLRCGADPYRAEPHERDEDCCASPDDDHPECGA